MLMAASDIIEHVEKLQELRFFRAFYRLAVLLALFVVLCLSIWFVSSVYSRLGLIRDELYNVQINQAILQDRMNSFLQFQLRNIEHDNANFDATKSQIRETTKAVRELHTIVTELKTLLPTKPEVVVPRPRRRRH